MVKESLTILQAKAIIKGCIEMINMNYHHYISALKDACIDENCFCPEWFESQKARINKWFLIEDNLQGAIYNILAFAKAQCGKGVVRDIKPLSSNACLNHKKI